MPSTYAHGYFGALVRGQLPEEIQNRLLPEQDLYEIGLQGPDLLFYYNPLKRNPVSEEGNRLHQLTGREFFAEAADALRQQEGETREAGLAYLDGVVCHFVLDSMCHGYINEYEKLHGVPHAVIEGDFDRSLIEARGRDPVKEDLVRSFHPSDRAGEVTAHFYTRENRKILTQSIRRFAFFHHILYCPGNRKRHALYLGLKMIGQYESLRGHIIADHADPDCAESDALLQRLLPEAVPVAVRLIREFPAGLRDPQYDFTFEGGKPSGGPGKSGQNT